MGASVIVTPACTSTPWASSVGQEEPAYVDFKDTAAEASQAAAVLGLSVHPEFRQEVDSSQPLIV